MGSSAPPLLAGAADPVTDMVSWGPEAEVGTEEAGDVGPASKRRRSKGKSDRRAPEPEPEPEFDEFGRRFRKKEYVVALVCMRCCCCC